MGTDPRASARALRADAEKRPDISQRKSTGRRTTGFDSFNLRPELLRAVTDLGFTEPRPIQVQAIPPALEGRDVLGLAQTGTGKTAAFVLPILQRLLGARRPGPRALVVAPTRELAAQVQADFERLAVHTKLDSVAIFGGVPIARQIRTLRGRPDVVVACPGRLLDLLSQGALCLDGVEVLVLDEADHMFDMGFLPDVRRILRALPQRRQNLLYSATMPREIRKLADTILRNPAVLELGNSRPAETISHALYPLTEPDKVGALERLLSGEDFRSAIVFLRTKRRAKRLAQRLEMSGHAAVAMQGNMSQPQRERALNGFREGRYAVLVATDIAARGLDIAGVSHVVNFDVPNTPDAYTHRIGRTGRSEQTGTAFTFVTPDDADAVRAIEKRLGARIERLQLAELGPIERSTLNGAKGRYGAKGRHGTPVRATRPGKASGAGRSKAGAARQRKAAAARQRNASRPRLALAGPVAVAVASRPAPAAGTAFGLGVLTVPGPKRVKESQSGGDAARSARRRRRRA